MFINNFPETKYLNSKVPQDVKWAVGSVSGFWFWFFKSNKSVFSIKQEEIVDSKTEILDWTSLKTSWYIIQNPSDKYLHFLINIPKLQRFLLRGWHIYVGGSKTATKGYSNPGTPATLYRLNNISYPTPNFTNVYKNIYNKYKWI